MRYFLRSSAKIALLVALVWALVWFGGFGLKEMQLIFSKPLLVAIAVLCVWAGQIFAARRFQLILRQQKIDQDFVGSLSLTCASQFAGNVLLGVVGGDGIRYLLLAPNSREASIAVLTAIALDRFLGLLGLLSIGIVASLLRIDLVLASDFLSRLLVVAVVFGVATIGGAIVFFGRGIAPRFFSWVAARLPGGLGRLVQALAHSFSLITEEPGLALRGFALSMPTNLMPICGFFAIVSMMPNVTMSPLDFAFIAPTALLANSLSITPGGLGVGEGAFELLARLVTAQPLVSFAALFFSFRLISAIATLPGLIPIVAKQNSVKQTQPQ